MTDTTFGPTDRIARLEIAADAATDPSPEREQERRVAEYELLEENVFRARGLEGPLAARLERDDGALTLALSPADGDGGGLAVALSTPAVREAAADYAALCEAYFRGVRDLAPSQIAQLDAERRAAHHEGAEAVRAALGAAAETDAPTARRLFSLVSVLEDGGA